MAHLSSSPNPRLPPHKDFYQRSSVAEKSSLGSQPYSSNSTTNNSTNCLSSKDPIKDASLSTRLQDIWDDVVSKEALPTDSPLTVDALLDVLVAIYDDYSSTELSKISQIPSFLTRYRSAVTRIKSQRLNKQDFQVVRKLTKGHFGMVSIVRNKHDGKIYAMKTLNKLYILKCKELSFYMEEKDVLILSHFSEWLPKLYASFQDVENLYLVMEYAGGGDLFSLLDRSSPPILDEDAARFYLAEIFLALCDLHSFNYVHRDLKPHNILIDNSGHVKLADFGSCIRVNKDGLITSNIPVGTSDYISPEVLQAQENRSSYGPECDWWSLGILLYELLQGDPPFSADSLIETHNQIMNHKKHLTFFGMYPISDEAKDLIQSLVCDREVRLGRNSSDEIKNHPFFNGIDWNNIRNIAPPFKPSLLTPDDTSNFSVYDEEEDFNEIKVAPKINRGEVLGTHLPFIGFTYQNYLKSVDPTTSTLASQLTATDDKPYDVDKVDPKANLEDKSTQTMSPENCEPNSELQRQLESPIIHLPDTDPYKTPPGSKELFLQFEEYISELKAELQASQELIEQKDEKIQQSTLLIDQYKEDLDSSIKENEKLSEELKFAEQRCNDHEDTISELKSQNSTISEERDKVQGEAKRLKRAITEFSKVHQDMKMTTYSIDQSREQADANFDIMKSKCDSLLYENQGLKIKLEKVEMDCRDHHSEEELSSLQSEVDKLNQTVHQLSLDLEAMTDANKSLISQIEKSASEITPEPVSPSVSIDNKLYTDMVANIELEAKNHSLLTNIYQDLQAQKDLRPALDDVRASRDEALQRSNQLLRLNEKQATLIRSLMDKVNYLESKHSNSDKSDERGVNSDNVKVSALVVENQNLKRCLAFKDQKLQEIVTKLVMAEANKPSFWPKSKERSKERQRVLVHSIQSLEQRLRLVERENSQLRFINQLAQTEAAAVLSPEQIFNQDSVYTSVSSSDCTQVPTDESSRRRSAPGTSKGDGAYSFNPSLLPERSLSTKLGVSHIK